MHKGLVCWEEKRELVVPSHMEEYIAITGLYINELEPFVIALRLSSDGTSKVITIPSCFFHVATSEGAKNIG